MNINYLLIFNCLPPNINLISTIILTSFKLSHALVHTHGMDHVPYEYAYLKNNNCTVLLTLFT